MGYTNQDGLTIFMHGEQGRINPTGGTVHSFTQTYVREIMASDLTNDAPTPEADDAFVTKGSYIKNAWVIVQEAFVGAGTLTIGTYEKDGTVIDADGIAAALALTALNAEGKVSILAGDQVGKVTTVGGDDAYIELTTNATGFSAGKAMLYVEYLPR